MDHTLNAKRIILTHMSADMLSQAAASPCEAAYDGLVVAVG